MFQMLMYNYTVSMFNVFNLLLNIAWIIINAFSLHNV